jgi:hypothetical protein
MSVISATLEAEIGRVASGGQPGQKVRNPVSVNKVGVVACTCYPSYVGDHR